MESKKEKFASFGVATKGVVYLLIGVLTAMAAFGYGGSRSSSKDILDFVAQQPLGQVLLLLISVGLLGYVFWRFYQSFANPKKTDNAFKNLVKRIAYFISGVLYGVLAYSALKRLIGNNESSSSFLSSLFDSDYAVTIGVVIGIILIIKGIYEFYQAYSGKFKENVEHSGISSKAQRMLMKFGRFGFTSRGIVAAILGYLFLNAALSGSVSKLGKTDAFGFISNEFGNYVLGIIAVGLAGYGIFMMIKAKYSSLVVG